MQHDPATEGLPARMERQPEKKVEEEAMSLEEIAKYRADAQQNSIDVMRAAEDRYAKAKDAAAAALQDTKEAVAHGVGAAATYAAVKGAEAKDAAAHGVRAAAAYSADKGAAAKDVIAEKAQQGYQVAKEKAVSAGRTAADYTQQGTEWAKDVTTRTGKSAAHHAKEMATQTMDVTVSTGKSTGEFVREKAVEAKDAAIGAAHRATEYASGAAAETKDRTGAAAQVVAQKAEAAKGAARSSAQENTTGGQKRQPVDKEKGEEVMKSCRDFDQGGAEKDRAEEAQTEKEIHGHQDDRSTKEQRLRELSVGQGHPSSLNTADSVEAAGQGEASVLRGEKEEASSSGVGGLLEAVGETVIGIAQTAMELLVGSERSR